MVSKPCKYWLASFRTGLIREGIGNAIGGISTVLPKSLPQAAGRLAVPGVNATVAFAGALIAGQSVQQAATTAVGTAVGSLAGGFIGTAIGGPIGGYVGSTIGSFVGGYLGNALFPQELPSTTARHESYTPNYQKFLGGQNVGVLYYVLWESKESSGLVVEHASAPLSGPITAFTTTRTEDSRWSVTIASNNGNTVSSPTVVGSVKQGEPRVTKIVRVDGYQDYGVDTRASLTPPPDNKPYGYSEPSPIGSDNVIPSGTPLAGLKRGNARNVSGSLPSNNTPNGAPTFTGHGGLAPSYLPNPEHQPSNLGGMLPSTGLQLQRMEAPAPKQPLPYAEPEDIPLPSLQPKNGLTVTPATITQSTITVSQGTDALGNNVSTRDRNTLITSVPSSTPSTAQPIPINDGNSRVPKANVHPIPKTPEQAATDKTNQIIEQQKKDFDEQIAKLTAIATAIAALTPAIYEYREYSKRTCYRHFFTCICLRSKFSN